MSNRHGLRFNSSKKTLSRTTRLSGPFTSDNKTRKGSAIEIPAESLACSGTVSRSGDGMSLGSEYSKNKSSTSKRRAKTAFLSKETTESRSLDKDVILPVNASSPKPSPNVCIQRTLAPSSFSLLKMSKASVGVITVPRFIVSLLKHLNEKTEQALARHHTQQDE